MHVQQIFQHCIACDASAHTSFCACVHAYVAVAVAVAVAAAAAAAVIAGGSDRGPQLVAVQPQAHKSPMVY